MLFHHLGIFVKSIDKSSTIFSRDLKAQKISEIIVDKDLQVKVQFFKDQNGITYELVEGIGKKNPVINTLEKNKNILNHVAYTSKDFDNQLKILNKYGYVNISNISKSVAFNGNRIVFLLSPLNFIIELIEN
mgnify:FL=1|tara:strand:- start:569 stop:964 length:396 start_codon:yes stop_codon:yes gene_type:complete